MTDENVIASSLDNKNESLQHVENAIHIHRTHFVKKLKRFCFAIEIFVFHFVFAMKSAVGFIRSDSIWRRVLWIWYFTQFIQSFTLSTFWEYIEQFLNLWPMLRKTFPHLFQHTSQFV